MEHIINAAPQQWSTSSTEHLDSGASHLRSSSSTSTSSTEQLINGAPYQQSTSSSDHLIDKHLINGALYQRSTLSLEPSTEHLNTSPSYNLTNPNLSIFSQGTAEMRCSSDVFPHFKSHDVYVIF